MKKNIACKDCLTFPADMYNNVYGSLAICAYIFKANKPKAGDIIAKWKYHKSEIYWGIEDKGFMSKTLKFFGFDGRVGNMPIAFVQSEYNCLFAPFVDGVLLPLREDGIKTYTLRNGKVYPIVNEKVQENV